MVMKRQLRTGISTLGFVLGLGSVITSSQAETLLWVANTEPDIAGYKIFYGESGASPTEINVGNVTSRDFSNLIAGRTYFFYATAYNTLGLESGPSGQLNYTVPTNPQNRPPTISLISNQTISEDSTSTVNFTVSDPDTSASTLNVSAASSNQSLLPNANLTPGGSGGTRSLVVRPAADQSGSANVTVSVSDGQLSASRTFSVTVSPVNDAPTIANVADRTVTQGSSTGSIPVTIGDRETAAGSLTLTAQSSNPTLVPQSGLALSGSGANRTLNVTPASTQSGEAIITLTVSDGALSASDTFRLTVGSGTGGQTVTVTENFEGPGYENPGWLELGTPDDDYTTVVIAGSYSLRTRDGERSYRQFTGATSADLQLSVLWREWTANHDVLQFANSGGAPVASVSVFNSRLRVTHGSVSASGTTAITLNRAYYTWLEWQQGTGANGRLALYLSSNSTKPSTPEAVVTTGNGGASDRFYIGGASAASPSLAFDRMVLTYSSGSTPPPSNQAPAIANVPNQTINANSSTGPLPVIISDPETSASSLTLTAQSSNPTLVPQSGLVLGGSGGNRTVTVNPAANQTGQATITLTVSDGALTASDTFIVSVQSGTPPPASFNLVEEFEGPGYENPGWINVGTPTDAYGRVTLDGTYALRTQDGSQAYRQLSGATSVNLYFMFLWRESTPTHTILDLSGSGGQPSGFVWIGNGNINVTHGSVTDSAPFSPDPDDAYHVWVEWSGGTGNDGVMSIFVGSSSAKPPQPIATVNTGNGGAVARVYFGGAAPDSPSILFDRVHMSDAPITVTP